jgi:hypothetical protein
METAGRQPQPHKNVEMPEEIGLKMESLAYFLACVHTGHVNGGIRAIPSSFEQNEKQTMDNFVYKISFQTLENQGVEEEFLGYARLFEGHAI